MLPPIRETKRVRETERERETKCERVSGQRSLVDVYAFAGLIA